MREFLIALVAGGAIAAFAAPALAQIYDESSLVQREDNIRDRINEGVGDGDLTYVQAGQLRSELRQIVTLDARYRYEGMSDWQSRDIDSRLDLLDSRVSYDVSMNRGDRDYGYGYWR
jgi:hypothetical protein